MVLYLVNLRSQFARSELVQLEQGDKVGVPTVGKHDILFALHFSPVVICRMKLDLSRLYRNVPKLMAYL